MRRLAPLAVLAGLALLVGTAHADTFAVVPETQATSPFILPTLTPNAAGSLVVPAELYTPPASTAQLSYTQLLGLWQRAGSTYGIPWQVLAAINKVESNFGRNMGPSSAGAIGWMQFMPDTWLRWGVDANGDGVADPWNPEDAIYSAARYLAAAGGTSDIYRGVFAYNHADWYVREVLGLAGIYGSDSTVAFSLDRMQQSLEAARAAVVAANDQLLTAQRELRTESKVVVRWQAAASHAALLSDRLALEQRAGLAEERRIAAAGTVGERTRTLAAAQQQLDRAQQASAAASFAPAASQLLAAPSYSSGYVFPVGGGPGVVTASHTHHDYPAVVPGASLAAGQPVGLVGATGHATGPHLHLQLQPATAWPQQEAWFQSFAGTAFTWSDVGANDAWTALRTPAVVGASPAASSPVFEVVTTPAPSDGGVVYFSRAGS